MSSRFISCGRFLFGSDSSTLSFDEFEGRPHLLKRKNDGRKRLQKQHGIKRHNVSNETFLTFHTLTMNWRLSDRLEMPRVMSFPNIRRCLVLTVLIGVAGLSLNAQAQRLYDKKRDELAQQAKQHAAELKSDPIFETQLKNLMTLEALDLETVISESKRDTRAIINSFDTWGNVFTFVNAAKQELDQSDERAVSTSRSVGEASVALEQEIKNAKAAIKKLRGNADTTEDQRLAMLFARVGEIDSLLSMAKKLIGMSESESGAATINALDKTRDTLKEITDLYDKYDTRLQQISTLKAQLGEFYISLQEAALRGLEAQEEHLSILGAIEARRSLELAEARVLIARYEAAQKRLLQDYYGRCFSDKKSDLTNERITDTVNLAMNMTPNCDVKGTIRTINMRPRDVVEDIMLDLYMATTIVSRVPASVRLAQLRRAHEEHRYAIKQRIVQSHAYELILNSGADRLALFYKGGIKPAQLAQLIYNVANIATPIAIIAK